LGDYAARNASQRGPNGGGAVSEISLDLLARTVLELMRLPKFDGYEFRELSFRAHELLTECARTIEHFERDNYTYKKAIREVTGRKRISEKDSKLFEEFYKDTYLMPSLTNLYGPNQERLERLQWWKDTDSVPIKDCLQMNPDFIKWHRKRRSEIESAKGVKGAKAKNLKNRLHRPKSSRVQSKTK
jgi:hypothetical protein